LLKALLVRHRIDGLEKEQNIPKKSIDVRHRIDGLEIKLKVNRL